MEKSDGIGRYISKLAAGDATEAARLDRRAQIGQVRAVGIAQGAATFIDGPHFQLPFSTYPEIK
jgi:hypothetical protein